MEEEPNRDKKISLRFKIAAILVAAGLFVTLLLPVFAGESGIDIIQEILGGSSDSLNPLGDDPPLENNSLAYHYEYFTPPADSFGLGNTTFKTVNWSYWTNWVNESIGCTLEKSPDGKGHWEDCTKLLVVDKVWNETNISVKFTYRWVSDSNSFYRVSYKLNDKSGLDSFCDESAKNNSDRYLLNCSVTGNESYNCYYDWSDYKNSAEFSKTTFTKNIKSNSISNKPEFIWSVTTDNVIKKGDKYEIDPIFGDQNTFTSTVAVTDVLRGFGTYSPSSDGTIDNVTALIKLSDAGDFTRAVIYNDDTGALVGYSATREGPFADPEWVVYTFSGSPAIYSATNYYLCLQGSGGSSYLGTDAGTKNQVYDATGDPWDTPPPDPEGYSVEDTFRAGSIYCSYSEGSANTAPTQSLQKIWNSTTSTEKSLNATGVSLTPTCFNVTIADTDSDYMNVTIKTNASDGVNWTTVNATTSGMTDGIYHGYNTSWVDSYNTKYWISFNVGDDSEWCNETYNFTTESAPNNAPTISDAKAYDSSFKDEFVLNISCAPKAPTSLNFTHNDTDSGKVNWTIYENNSGSWKEVASGTNSPVNATNTTANTSWINQCCTKYYISINISDGTDWTNETYWLETIECPDIVAVSPVNGTVCINLTSGNFSVQVSDPCGYNMHIILRENSTGTWRVVNSSGAVSNGTYYFTNTSWVDTANTTYWWNVSVFNIDYCYTNETYHFTTAGIPIQSNPDPANGTDCVIPGVHFNITANDPCGGLMSINASTNKTGTWVSFYSTSGVGNGTYEMTTTKWADTTNTTYWWRVVVNNSNAGISNETYHFTTVGPPTQSNPVPSDSETCVLCDTVFNITVNDPCGLTMDIDLFYNDTKLGTWVNFNSTIGVGNGTYTFTNNTWLTACNVTHQWAVNVTNSEGEYVNITYNFTTVEDPVATIITPLANEVGTELVPTVEIWANDSCGSLLTVKWYEKVGGDYHLKQTNNSVTANTTVSWVFTNASSYCTEYNWMVKVNNSCCDDTLIPKFATLDDAAPVYSNENPANNSGSQNLAFTWNITIQSPNGTTFDWSINCSNGQANNSNSDINGSKNLSISGLAYSTTYTVWVNSTSSCGQINSEWFQFTTKSPANNPPAQGQESPDNGSVCICTDSPTINIKITDPDGDKMNISAQENSSGSWKEFNASSDVNNGSASYTNTSWIDTCNTTYWWRIILDDGQNYTNVTYHFTTSTYPTIYVIYPTNGSSSIPLQPTVEIYANDSCGRDLDVFWYENTTGSWVLRQTNSTVTANTTVEWNYSQADTYDTTYWWKVALNNSCCNTSWIMHFTTGTAANNCPVLTNDNPTNGSTGVSNATVMWNITIVDPDGDTFNWSIEASTGDINSSTLDTNGSYHVNFTTPLTNCATIHIWVNVTDGNCTVNETFWFVVNCPDVLSIELSYPTNGSTGICPCCMYIEMNVSSPNGALMNITTMSNWSGSWQAIQYSPIFANVTNGTYCFLPMEFIIYNRTYWWNASVNNGTNTVDSEVYHFTTAVTPDLCNYGSGSGYIITDNTYPVIGLIGLFGLIGFLFRRKKRLDNY